MVFKWHIPEILENYGLSKHDKFPRRATGQLGPENDIEREHHKPCNYVVLRTETYGDFVPIDQLQVEKKVSFYFLRR